MRHSRLVLGWKLEALGLGALAIRVKTPRLGDPPSAVSLANRRGARDRDAKLRVKWVHLINKCMPPQHLVGPQAMSSWGLGVTSIAPWPTKARPSNLCRTCNHLSGPPARCSSFLLALALRFWPKGDDFSAAVLHCSVL